MLHNYYIVITEVERKIIKNTIENTIPKDFSEPFSERMEVVFSNKVFYCKSVREACLKADLIIIHTEWDEFKTLDFKKISKNKRIKIYDMRNLYSPKKMRNLGYSYYSIGR